MSFVAVNDSLLVTLSHVYTHFDASVADIFLKTLWQMEKLLIMSNFFICHNVFNFIRLYLNLEESVSHLLPTCDAFDAFASSLKVYLH